MKKAGLTRRSVLKIPAVALGGLAVGSAMIGCGGNSPSSATAQSGYNPAQANTLFNSLPPFYPGEALASNEMRISFMGTSCIPRLSQECNSVFVEVGNALGQADQFVFDCGTGVIAKYNAMGILMSRMNKIFFTHLHADHTSDLIHIYGFGPAEDRKAPLYIWGPSPSLLTDPGGYVYNDDGVVQFCQKFRDLMRWHTESFSFGATSYASNTPATQALWGTPTTLNPVVRSDGVLDANTDGYAIVPIELNWQKFGAVAGDNVAYNNPATGVKITHFPAIHCRQGSVSYKLEWNGMSIIFTGDTKPNYNLINQAKGVDVLIHEMVVSAKTWAMKNLGITDPSQVSTAIWTASLDYAQLVQDSSHTPQGAFGYILSQITPPPRLAVATHFQAEDDTIGPALTSVRNHYPVGDVTWASDFMVINVSRSQIRQRRAVVSDYAFYPVVSTFPATNISKYHNADGSPNPYAQINTADAVPQVNPATGLPNWNADGT